MNRFVLAVALFTTGAVAHADTETKTFIDVHHLPKGLSDEQLAADHKKDIQAERSTRA